MDDVMKKLFAFFAKNHLLANLLTVMVLLLGIVTGLQINRDQFPDIDLGFVFINTVYPGASPEDVELNVTNKIEKSLKGITGIKKLQSSSIENVSTIYIEIDPDTDDPDKVKSEIREAVNRVTDLPEEVTESPLVTEARSSNFPVIDIGIIGDVPYRELREYAGLLDKKIRDVKGVQGVDRWGYRDREIIIETDPEKVQFYEMPMHEIINQIQMRNIRSSGGSLESYTNARNVVTLAQFKDPMEVGEVILRTTFEGPLIKLKDLAVIKDDFEEVSVFPRINGQDGISLEVIKSKNADIIRTVNAIKKLLATERETLPDGIEIVITYDMSTYVKSMFEVVRNNGLLGLLFVIIILSLFLNIRSAVWVAMGIPFSLLATVVVLPLFDMYLDVITLLSMVIVIGIIVDDAIIITENIFQKREQGLKPLDAVVTGLNEVYKPVLVTILTTFLVFAPIFFMKGMLGKFVFVIPFTISVAIFISLFEAFFVLPAHILAGIKKRGIKGKSSGRAWFKPIKEWYRTLMSKVLRLRYLWIGLSVLLIAGTFLYAYKVMGFVLFPTRGADLIYSVVELPTGSPLARTTEKISEVEEIINELPREELESYLIRVGAYTLGWSFTNSENFAMVYINLTPFTRRKRTADEIVEYLRQKTSTIEGIKEISFEIDSGGPPTGKPIEMRITGSNDMLRKQAADDVYAFLGSIDGVKDLNRNDKEGKQQIQITIDYEKLARLGLTVSDIASNVRIAFDGQIVTRVRYGEEDVGFRLTVDPSVNREVSYLRNLLVTNRQNRLIRLGQVADFTITPGVNAISHYDTERSVTITGGIDTDKTTSQAVARAVNEKFDFSKEYPGVRFMAGGEAQETQDAMIDLLITFGIAILGIYFLLILLFKSFTQPLVVMVAIPFGIVGIIISFALHGEQLGFLGMIGLIGMSGVVVNDSLVMVNHLNSLVKGKSREDLIPVIAGGAADRLRPILLTTLTTVSGMIPLAYGIGGENVFMRPMALALGFGLFFATPVTLIIVPSLYVIGTDIRAFLKRPGKAHRVK
jgi:multidrug efflux pump subunit AcrB